MQKSIQCPKCGNQTFRVVAVGLLTGDGGCSNCKHNEPEKKLLATRGHDDK